MDAPMNPAYRAPRLEAAAALPAGTGAIGFGGQPGRGIGPRRSGGTWQLLTRCSSEALSDRRSFKVNASWANEAEYSVNAIAAYNRARMSQCLARGSLRRSVPGQVGSPTPSG